MVEEGKIRIDKWMWAVRIYKTRSIAAEACKKGRVMIQGVTVKPSREVRINEVVQVKVPPIIRSYKVKAISGKRMGAKLAVDFVEDVTTEDQLNLLRATQTRGFEYRDRGVGRPTKHDRRMIEKLKNEE